MENAVANQPPHAARADPGLPGQRLDDVRTNPDADPGPEWAAPAHHPGAAPACDPPMRIAMLTYADLTGKRDAEPELAKIVRALGGTPQPPQAGQPNRPAARASAARAA